MLRIRFFTIFTWTILIAQKALHILLLLDGEAWNAQNKPVQTQPPMINLPAIIGVEKVFSRSIQWVLFIYPNLRGCKALQLAQLHRSSRIAHFKNVHLLAQLIFWSWWAIISGDGFWLFFVLVLCTGELEGVKVLNWGTVGIVGNKTLCSFEENVLETKLVYLNNVILPYLQHFFKKLC